MARARSEAGAAIYRAAHARLLSRWPSGTETRILPGRIADTHLIQTGPGDAPPLLFLPAVAVSAVAYRGLAHAIGRRRLIAADVPGDAGLSVAHRPMRAIRDLADWLEELVAGLGLVRPNLAGHSYGGWIALGAAAREPGLFGPLTLAAPASGLAPFRWNMALFLRAAEYLPFRPSAARVLRAQAAPGYEPDPDFVALMEAMTRHLRTEVPFPGPYDDATLARVAAPLRLILAEHEVLYDTARAADRARLIPGATIATVRGAGHLLPIEKPEEVAGLIL